MFNPDRMNPSRQTQQIYRTADKSIILYSTLVYLFRSLIWTLFPLLFSSSLPLTLRLVICRKLLVKKFFKYFFFYKAIVTKHFQCNERERFPLEHILWQRANSEHVNNLYAWLNDRESLKSPFRPLISMKTWPRARIFDGQWLLRQNRRYPPSKIKHHTYLQIDCHLRANTNNFLCI